VSISQGATLSRGVGRLDVAFGELSSHFDRRDGIALWRAAKSALQMGHEAEQPAAWVMFSGQQAP
jgi:hypothetical protein